jgi:hypothetical protein
VISQLEDIFRMHHHKRNSFTVELDGVKQYINKKLLWKLNNYGIRGNTWKWVSAFLSNRMQQVALDGEVSGQLPVVSGVPQGSVLAHCFFSYS